MARRSLHSVGSGAATLWVRLCGGGLAAGGRCRRSFLAFDEPSRLRRIDARSHELGGPLLVHLAGGDAVHRSRPVCVLLRALQLTHSHATAPSTRETDKNADPGPLTRFARDALALAEATSLNVRLCLAYLVRPSRQEASFLSTRRYGQSGLIVAAQGSTRSDKASKAG